MHPLALLCGLIGGALIANKTNALLQEKLPVANNVPIDNNPLVNTEPTTDDPTNNADVDNSTSGGADSETVGTADK